MKYDKSISNTVNTSTHCQWTYIENSDSYIFKNNKSIRIKKNKINLIDDLFNEEWATKLFSLPAYRRTIKLFYNNELIKELIFIEVDNFKALVPITIINTLNIKEIDYKYSLILNKESIIKQYINKLNLKII